MIDWESLTYRIRIDDHDVLKTPAPLQPDPDIELDELREALSLDPTLRIKLQRDGAEVTEDGRLDLRHEASGAVAVGLYAYHDMTAWFDEVYVGADTTMGFRTPDVLRTGVSMDRPEQAGWTSGSIGPRTKVGWLLRQTQHVNEMNGKSRSVA